MFAIRVCVLAVLMMVGAVPGSGLWSSVSAVVAAEEGAGDHGHADNTHADATSALESPSAVRSDMALFSLVVFVLLLVGLYLFAWKPISEGLAKRESDIQALISKAQTAAVESTAKLQEYERKLQQASEEAQQTLAQARKDAEATGQRLIAEAQAEAKQQKDRAVSDIETAKRAALTELSERSTDLALVLARRIVGRELRAEDHQKLIQEVLGNLPSRN